MPMTIQFAPFSSLVHPSLWHRLTELKLDVLRLSDEAIPITATYTVGRTVKDRETGQEVGLGCVISVEGDNVNVGPTFKTAPAHGQISAIAPGTLKNFNTIEEFKNADKTALFNQLADQIWSNAIQTKDPSRLSSFLLITYADLKKYKYFYWFAFPAFANKPAWEIDDQGWSRVGTATGLGFDMPSIQTQLEASHLPFFLIKQTTNGKTEIASVDKWDTFYANVDASARVLGFVDPSPSPTNPGWPLRNLLAYVRALNLIGNSIKVLCWRDTEAPADGSWRSLIGLVSSTSLDSSRPGAVGWEKNAQGKLAPRMADLAPMMDPTRLASQAVDLNLKLMRWRILPSLELDNVANTRCLLLGAGTLGCYVARTLMGWGVRTVTLVDSARVSFSNPVRQPLFEFEDCLDGGKPKAECAAMRLKRIFPGLNATGHNLAIPMPGHPVPVASVEQTRKDIQKLEELFDNHDAVFLLMDSRESRWLPTVLGAAKGKIVMNAALGFDTFLVMRHGARTSNSNRLGCYFCNDIVAPTDSLTDRTLDQMCTVSRPGLAPITAATAVELLVSIIQHPDGHLAPAPPPQTSNSDDPTEQPGSSVLGLVPHQIRGFLSQFRNLPIVGAAYDRCTGCSETVLKAYEKDGFDMILKACNDAKYLESLTGLDKLHEEVQESMDKVDWVDEGDEDDDF